MHIIAIWNTKGRNCLNACNKNWLKELDDGVLHRSRGEQTPYYKVETKLKVD
jgi:hypothetical protein